VVCRQVANERVAQARQRFAGHLVEVVDNLDSSCVSDASGGVENPTFPFSVVAANSFAPGSTLFASSMASVACHASFCSARGQQ
jgi:hypothetical protein